MYTNWHHSILSYKKKVSKCFDVSTCFWRNGIRSVNLSIFSSLTVSTKMCMYASIPLFCHCAYLKNFIIVIFYSLFVFSLYSILLAVSTCIVYLFDDLYELLKMLSSCQLLLRHRRVQLALRIIQIDRGEHS